MSSKGNINYDGSNRRRLMKKFQEGKGVKIEAPSLWAKRRERLRKSPSGAILRVRDK